VPYLLAAIRAIAWLFVAMPTYLFAQVANKQFLAQQFLTEAISIADKEQRYDDAVNLLLKARGLDSRNPTYSYEIAYMRYQQKKYAEVIKFLRPITRSAKANADYYHLLGNAYDLSGNGKRAERTYRRGIKRFKQAGSLYAEMGGLAYKRGNNDMAVDWWEKGIEQDPNFATNYYWASKLYCHSSEEIWGLQYAELFMNLEPNGARNEEISQMLYEVYANALHPPTDSTAASVSFSHKAQMYLLLNETQNDTLLPFQVAYNLDAEWAMPLPLRDKSLNTLYWFRKDWLSHYYAQQHDKYYNNIVFERQQDIAQNHHLEAYTYWLLRKGKPQEFEQWLKEHPYTYKAFIEWFNNNTLRLNKDKLFYRRQYLQVTE
jgi:tetratricopeptide (TPR) repeat protein